MGDVSPHEDGLDHIRHGTQLRAESSFGPMITRGKPQYCRSVAHIAKSPGNGEFSIDLVRFVISLVIRLVAFDHDDVPPWSEKDKVRPVFRWVERAIILRSVSLESLGEVSLGDVLRPVKKGHISICYDTTNVV